MADFFDPILDRQGDLTVPWVIHTDGGEWAKRVVDSIYKVLPADHWKLAVRPASDESVESQLTEATGNAFAPSIVPLSVYRGAPGWYLYCGQWPGPEALRTARQRADAHKLTLLVLLTVPDGKGISGLDVVQLCAERGLVILVDEKTAAKQNMGGALEGALGALLGHAWLKIPGANGSLSDVFGLRQGRGVFTVGVGIDRPDLGCHAAVWGRQIRAKLAGFMLSGDPAASAPAPSPAWPESFASLLDPSSFSRAASGSSADFPETRIDWPQPGGGSIDVCYHGRPVLRPVDDGSSIRAWLSKVRGLRELESFLAVFGFEAADGYARLRAIRDSHAFVTQIHGAAKLPEAAKGIFTGLKRNLLSWGRFGAAGSQGTIHDSPPSQALPAMIHRIEQQVMRQPSVLAVSLRLGLILVAGLWLVLGPALWKPGAVIGRGSPAFLGGLGMLAGLVVLTAMAAVWVWYAFRRAFWAYERALDNIETRYLHRAMKAVLESLKIEARQVEQESKKMLARLEQAQVALQEKVQAGLSLSVGANANRRFPEDAIRDLLAEVEDRLVAETYVRFCDGHREDLLSDDERWAKWFESLDDCSRNVAVRHLNSLSYDIFAQVAGLSQGQQNAILQELKMQTTDGLWPGARDMNANPWLLIPPMWRDLAVAQANPSRILEQSLPVVAAIGLIPLPLEESLAGEALP